MTEPIVIDVPVTIRQFTPGGKGGYGGSSSPLHRLIERRGDGDLTACRVFIAASNHIAVKNGKPRPGNAQKWGVCPKCWPSDD